MKRYFSALGIRVEDGHPKKSGVPYWLPRPNQLLACDGYSHVAGDSTRLAHRSATRQLMPRWAAS